jgi:hypothetical protein
MNFRSYYLTITMILSAAVAFCQANAPTLAADTSATKVALSTATKTIYGYRVQVFFGNDRKTAYFQQAKFKALYPELNAYISYTQPNYRVKVGDFKTRAEAQQLMSKLRPDFPTLFIFNERIKVIDTTKAIEPHVN